MQYTRRLLTFAALLCLSIMSVQAQQPPVPTVDVNNSGSNNLPTIDITPGAALPTATQASPDNTLPQVSDRICPPQVDYQAVSVVCTGLVTDEACIAQGTVNASPRVEDANFSFSQPGDRTRLSDLSELNLQSLSTESGTWSVVAANLPLNTNDPKLTAPAIVTMLLIGDVSIANASRETAATTSSRTASAKVIGTAGINVRHSPSGSAAAVYQLSPGTEVTATGKLENGEGRWIRIVIPNQYQGVGWVFATYLDVEGDADNLRTVLEGLPVSTAIPDTSGTQTQDFGPMQSFSLLSGVTDASCTGTPDSGLLLQTPNGIGSGSGAKLRVNGVEIVLNGTAFIQAQPNVSLRLTILEGEASITANGSTQQAQAISQVAVTMGQNLEPVNAPTSVKPDTAKIEALPVDLLDRSFLIDESLVTSSTTTQTNTGQGGSLTDNTTTTTTTDQPPAATSDGGISNTAAQPTDVPPCVLSAGPEDRNIRVSPDINASVSGFIRANTGVQSTNVVRDAKFASVYWFEVEKGFMRYDTVIASEGCQPLIDAVLPNAPRATIDLTPQPTVDPLATVLPTATVAEAPTTGVSLSSSDIGEVCGAPEGKTVSAAQKGGAVDLAVGGTWTVNRGGNILITVEGVNAVRNDYGDIFRIVDMNNQVLISSGELKEKLLDFPTNLAFQIRVGASEGELVIVRVACR